MTDERTANEASTGLLVVLAGPSGVGKGTVLRRVLAELADAEVSISATTREPRSGEVDGQHYHFLSEQQFRERIDRDDFLEWAEYAGNLYGTPLSLVRQRLAVGAVVVLEIEVQGARQIHDRQPDALLLFLAPPSLDELERRLRHRGTEDPVEVERRMEVGRWEMSQAGMFDHVIVNADVEAAAQQVIELIAQARRTVR